MPTDTRWTDTDVYMALDEALSDLDVPVDVLDELKREIVKLCMLSPKAFRRLFQFGKKAQLAGELVRRAYAASFALPNGAAFRAWLDVKLPGASKSNPTDMEKVLLTRSQRTAWAALEETADLYFSGELQKARILPRTSRLIAGPSGVGKSHLVSKFAAAKGYAFLRLTYGAWLPNGSRTERTTSEQVMKFLTTQERCVIMIDELDKIHGQLRHEWSISVQNDLYALLDRTWFQGTGGFSLEVKRRLRDCTFFVGCGTWQDLWAVKGGARPSIGFHQPAPTAMSEEIRRAQVIPTELMNRFHPEILLLDPMTKDDFAQVCTTEGLDRQADELGLALDFADAEASGLGMRWVESLVLKLNLARRQRRLEAPANLPPSL